MMLSKQNDKKNEDSLCIVEISVRNLQMMLSSV